MSFDHSASLAEHLRKSLTGVAWALRCKTRKFRNLRHGSHLRVALRVVLRPFSRLDGVQLARSIIRHERVGRAVGRSFVRSFGVLGERSVGRTLVERRSKIFFALR